MEIDAPAISIVYSTLTKIGLDISDLTPNTKLGDLPIDSTDCLDLQFRLERECQCQLPTIHRHIDIGDIIEMVASQRR